MRWWTVTGPAALVLTLAGPLAAGAQTAVASPLVDGPPMPTPPAVMARDAAGRVTVRAVGIDTPVWRSKSRLTEQGWTVETVIPFRSLRYRGDHRGRRGSAY